jgi:hypothetical protein
VLRAEGEAKAIETVFGAIHAGDADPKLLAYQYLLTLPKLAEGDANKLWIIPSEFTEALKGVSAGFFPTRDPGVAAAFGAAAATVAKAAEKAPAKAPTPRTRSAKSDS